MSRCKQAPAFALALLVALLWGGSGVALGAAPVVKGISPNNGSVTGGTQVTVTGEGFISGSTVQFGSSAGTGVVIESSKQIKVTSPLGTGLVGVSVSNSNGTSAATPYDQFGYDTAPTALWLGLDGNNSTFLGPVGYFAEREVVYDRSGPIEFTAGELPSGSVETDVENGMIPVVVIEYEGYDRPNVQFKSDPEFPQKRTGKEVAEGKNTIKTYVHGFVKTALAVLHEAANKDPEAPVLLEPMNEPWGYTTPQYNGAEYGEVIAELLPEAQSAGIPLSDIYVGATGKGWVPAMYKAQVKLETAIQGWYLHPYGPPSGTHEENSAGIQSLPYVQAEMTSGQNNIIVSEVGYCAIDVNEGIACPKGDTETSTTAAANLTEMLDNAKAYHEQGWLKALLVFSRNDGGWAMQVEPKVGTLTKQGEALEAFAESQVGWSILSTSNIAGSKEDGLNGVSCIATTYCLAVGSYQSKGSLESNAVSEFLKGTEWKSDASVSSEAPNSRLYGVSCVSSTACTAVGEYASATSLMAERWNGTKWQSQAVPKPAEKMGGRLTGVSCWSAKACAAVGWYVLTSNPLHPQTLAESWGGTEWQLQSTTDPSLDYDSLNDVSCMSSTMCLAVGVTQRKVLVEEWSGTTWQTVAIPMPAGEISELLGVSCSSLTDCIAVGRYSPKNGGGPYFTLVERWSGGKWNIESVPSPLGAQESRFTGISCMAAPACVAVGTYKGRSGVERTYTELWNGVEWSVQPMPDPAEAMASRLEEVSCVSPLTCVAVGESEDASHEWSTLAEANF